MIDEDIEYLIKISTESEKKLFIKVASNTVVNLQGYQPNNNDVSNI